MRKEINMDTYNKFKAGRENGTVNCPTQCPHSKKKGCPFNANVTLCWNAYLRWAGEKDV